MKIIARQGDVCIYAVDALPQKTKKVDKLTVALGEVTGHKHNVLPTTPTTTLEWTEQDRVKYLKVSGGSAAIYHGTDGQIKATISAPSKFDHVKEDTHAPIELPEGLYAFRIQRVYDKQLYAREVAD